MEPRPQKPRSAPEHAPLADPAAPTGQAPGAGERFHVDPAAAPLTGPDLATNRFDPSARLYPPQPLPQRETPFDPSQPPPPRRLDYDYRPLDLPPPEERRRRRLALAVLGVLGVMLLFGGGALAYVMSRDDNQDPPLSAAGSAATATRAAEIALAAGSTTGAGDPTNAPDGSTQPTSAAPTTAPPPVLTADAAAPAPTATRPLIPSGAGASAARTTPPPDGGTGSAAIEEFLPAEAEVPAGFVLENETTRTQADVAEALGGTDEAAQLLTDWGWSANIERAFSVADPAAVPPGGTTEIVLSVHEFGGTESAAAALTYFSDVLASSGFADIQVEPIGDQTRALSSLTDAGTNVAIYVQSGAFLIRAGGFSPLGDPTVDLAGLIQTVLPSE